MFSDEEEEEYSACEDDLSDASDWIVGGGGGDDDDGDDYIEGDGGGDCARKRRIHTIKLEGPAGEHFWHFKKLLSEVLSKRSGDLYKAIQRMGQLSFPAPNPLSAGPPLLQNMEEGNRPFSRSTPLLPMSRISLYGFYDSLSAYNAGKIRLSAGMAFAGQKTGDSGRRPGLTIRETCQEQRP